MQQPISQRIAWLQRHIGIGGVLLFASSWQLWTPGVEFPQVPLVYAAGSAPLWLQWILAAAVPIALLAIAIVPNTSPWSSRAFLLFVAAYMGLVLIDQQRLQPWAYQLAIMAIVLVTASPNQAVRLLRVLVISIYIYSAIAKLDYTFLHTIGSQFLDQLARLLHLPQDSLTGSQQAALALAFPLTELAIAICLAVPGLRRAGLVISTVMHLTVLLIVGPLGLHHKPAVLLWNILFVVQNMLLFGRTTASKTRVDVDQKINAKSSGTATLALGIVVLWPLLEPFGLCDHWLAWGLYAPRASRVHFYIHSAAVGLLPENIQPFLEANDDSDWRQLYLDRWSLAARGVPVYPQARVQFGIATAVIGERKLERAFRLIRFGPADRWTGERDQEILRTLADVERALSEHLLNARPSFRAPHL